MEYTIHHAKPEDSFHRLAHRYNTTAQAILDTHNQIANTSATLTMNSIIHPNDKIYIPINYKTDSNIAYAIYHLDGLTSIYTLAKYYEVSVEEVRAFNSLPIESPFGYQPIKVPLKSYHSTKQQSGLISEETLSSLSICTPTACTENELIVEIVGKISTRDDQQKIVIFTEQDQYDETKTLQVKKESFVEDTETLKTSVLHKWDWSVTDKAHLWLEVKSTQGLPIRVPLLNGKAELQKANLTPLKPGRHTQDNLIVPIVPMTQTIDRNDYATSSPVKEMTEMTRNNPILCRPGWLYVFMAGKLWRELEIRQNQTTGNTTYHDVRLYGQEGSLHSDGRVDATKTRTPEGVGLKDIWLPARLNDVAQTLQFFYTESQLTAARLNEYLKKPDILKKRAHTINMLPTVIPFGSLQKVSNNNPFLLCGKKDNKFHCAQEHLPRDFTKEVILQEPTKFLQDKQYLSAVFDKTKTLNEKINNSADAITGKYTTSNFVGEGYLIANISISAWSYHLKEKLKNAFRLGAPTKEQLKDPKSPWVKYQLSTEEKTLWCQTAASQLALTNTQPVLSEAINKKICGVYLFDALNWTSFLQQQIYQCWELQQLLADQATLRDNHGSALLVQNVMYESGSQDKDDPRYKAVEFHIKAKDSIGKGIAFALGAREREHIRQEIDIRQALLFSVLSHPMTVESIKDTTACLGFDKLGGCKNLANIMLAFSPSSSTDPLVAPSRKANTSWVHRQAHQLLEKGQPYYNVLYEPVEDTNALLAEYKKVQIASVEPRGDGLWQPEAFAELEKMSDADFENYIAQDKVKTAQGNWVVLEAKMGINETMTIAQKAIASMAAYAGNISAMIKQQLILLSKAEADKTVVDNTHQILTAKEQQLNEELTKLKQEQQDIINNKLPENKQKIIAQQQAINKLETQKNKSIEKYNLLTEKIEKRIAQLNTIKSSPTATDSTILSWIKPTALERELQQIVIQKRENAAKLIELYAQQENLTQRITDIDTELTNTQQQITETKAKIQEQRNNTVNNNRGVKVTLKEKLAFTDLHVARQLAAESLGNVKLQEGVELVLDNNGKLNPDLQQGEWLPIGIFNDDLVDGLGDGRRRDIYQAEIGIIKIDKDGNAIPPKGFSQKMTNTAVSQGHTVVVKGLYIVMNRSSKQYKALRKATRELKTELAKARDQYTNLAESKAGLLRNREAVNQEIEALEKETTELSKQQNELLAQRKNHQIDQREQEIAKLGEQKELTQEKITANEARIAELEKQQVLSNQERAELKTRQEELATQRTTLEAQNAQYHSERVALDSDIAKIETELKSVSKRILRLQGHTLFSNLASKSARTVAMSGIRIRNTAINIFQHPTMPFILAGFEVWNAKRLMEDAATMSSGRLRAESINLLFNSIAALEGMTAVLMVNSARYEAIIAQKSLVPIPALLAKLGVKTISVRFLLQGPGAIIGAGLAGADMWTDIQNQDWGALIGDSIIFTSAIAGLFATAAATASLLAAPVVGWVIIASLILLAIGVSVKALFQDTPFEKWVKFGPFGSSNSNFTYLQDEKEAFYQLVGLLAQLTLTTKELKAKDITPEQWQALTGEEKPKQLIMVSLTSAIPWLLGDAKEYYLAGDIHFAPQSHYGTQFYQPEYYYQQKNPYGVNFYLDCSNDILPIARADYQQVKEGMAKRNLTPEQVKEKNKKLRNLVWQNIFYLVRIQIEMIGQEQPESGENTNGVIPYLFPIPDNQLLKKKITFTQENRTLPELRSITKDNSNFWLTDNYAPPRGGLFSVDNNGYPITLTEDEAKRLGML